LVPGGGPSLDGDRWIESRHPRQPNRRKPFLVDNVQLGHAFRDAFVEGVKRLVRRGRLRLDGDWSRLRDLNFLEDWLSPVTNSDWNVFIEGPPRGKSDPRRVLKYLARYMTGGPISDRRMIRDEENRVTFWARSKDQDNRSRPFTVHGREFVRRWSMHVLPKGFTKSRRYGGYHGAKRGDYLERCRRLFAPSKESAKTVDASTPSKLPKCPRCEIAMECLVSQPRRSWREVFAQGIYDVSVTYSPMLHLGQVGFPARASDPYG